MVEIMDSQKRHQQAQAITQGILSNSLVQNDAVFSHWLGDSDCFWYVRLTKTGQEYRLVNAAAATNEPISDSKLLARIETELSAQMPQDLRSPDGQKAVFTRDHNLWIREISSGEERALTEDGVKGYAYAIDRFGSPTVNGLWSPDSQKILTYQLDQRQVGVVPIIHHIPADGSLRPQLEEWKTSFPGDKTVETYRLVVVDTNSGEIQAADYAPLPLTRNGYSFFSAEKMGWWAKDNQHAFFVEVERGTQTVRVVKFDTNTGLTRILFEEHDSSFIKHHLPGIGEPPIIMPLADTDELVWLSERSGYAHLYLYDLDTGKCKRQITEGNWFVQSVVHIDTVRRELLVQTTGRNSNSPFYRDLCRVSIDTGLLTPLISDAHEYTVYGADSNAVNYRHAMGMNGRNVSGVSPSGNYIAVTRSRVDEAPVSLLLDREGHLVLSLETANIDGLPDQWQWPEPITVKSADGQTDVYGVIYRPPGFLPDQQYPVLDFSMAHPAFRSVPRSAFINAPFLGACYLEAAAYAALGFIVVMMDGPAEAYRRKALGNSYYPSHTGHMASAFAFTDRIAGLQQLAERFPYMDIKRLGIVSGLGVGDAIYGLLEHPDIYKVGVVADFEDIRFMPSSWSELFIQPNQNISREQKSIIYAEHQAASLQGKLLLIHNMLDPEPPLTTTMRMIAALKKANKDYDLLLMPTTGHETSNYATRRTWDYLVEHLQGLKPPKDSANYKKLEAKLTTKG